MPSVRQKYPNGSQNTFFTLEINLGDITGCRQMLMEYTTPKHSVFRHSKSFNDDQMWFVVKEQSQPFQVHK